MNLAKFNAEQFADNTEPNHLPDSEKVQLLTFSLGTKELFGINVFKIREIIEANRITRIPYPNVGLEGVISLRGNIIPIISPISFIYPSMAHSCAFSTLIVAEFRQQVQAFLVQDVDRIIRVHWHMFKTPENISAKNRNYINAVVELENGHLVSIIDVEQILVSVMGEPSLPKLASIEMKKPALAFGTTADDR